MFAILIGAVVGIGLVYLSSRKPRSDPRASTGKLMRLCRGDADRADRLIALEISRSPGISRSAAASRAVQALQRDGR